MRRLTAEEVCGARRDPVDAATLRRAAEIVERVRTGGETELRALAEELGDLRPGQPLILGRDELERAAAEIDPEILALLERTADRIAAFADAQRRSVVDLKVRGTRRDRAVTRSRRWSAPVATPRAAATRCRPRCS